MWSAICVTVTGEIRVVSRLEVQACRWRLTAAQLSTEVAMVGKRLVVVLCCALLFACTRSLESRVQHEIDVNPDLAANGLVVKLVEEKDGYVTLSVNGVRWGNGPGWDAKNGIRRGELFSQATLYWGGQQCGALAGLEQVLAKLDGIKRLKWQIPDSD